MGDKVSARAFPFEMLLSRIMSAVMMADLWPENSWEWRPIGQVYEAFR